MTDAEILYGVRSVAAAHLGYEGPLEGSMRLVEDLLLDSIKILTLAVEIENHFRVRLPEEIAGEIATVADLVEAIRRAS